MARWTEDRERRAGERERREEGWRGRGWRDERTYEPRDERREEPRERRGDERRDDRWPRDEEADDWRVGGWRAGERGEWHGGAREWEARDRDADRDRPMQGGGEWGVESEGAEHGERGWRGAGGEGRGRWGERGGFGVGWRADEQRYGPGPGYGPTAGPGGMYGGAGGAYGGSSYGGSGLSGAYRGTLRGDRSRGVSGPARDEDRWGGGERDFDEGQSPFTRHLRRYGGRGPKGYKRSDERIREDVSERIARSWVDASDVEVKVENGEVTLTGFVESREEKRALEDLADDVFGVEEVHNQVRRRREETRSQTFTPADPEPPARH